MRTRHTRRDRIRTTSSTREKASVLGLVLVILLCLTILGVGLLSQSGTDAMETAKAVNAAQAFWAAEAGVQRLSARLYDGEAANIEETPLGTATYQVAVYDGDSPYAISTGRAGDEEKRIRVGLSYLAPPYEHALHAVNRSGQKWRFALRGKGAPQRMMFQARIREVGGRDMVNGDVYVNGDAMFSNESSVNPAPSPNTYKLRGDVEATGEIHLNDSAAISGGAYEHAPPRESSDLLSMDYETINTHHVSRLFADAAIGQGHLPSGHELYNVVVKNPSDRRSECDSTPGDDYFFEPAGGFVLGDEKGAATPLNLGNDRIYYVDGDVWIHSQRTYGFLVEGKATIVATGNIHICDNTQYADSESLLGFVALGKYDSLGQLVSGGDILFGDPRYGTTYTVSAFMFAGDDFLYNTDSVTRTAAEPTTGFSVFGNFSAQNQVSVRRDWYDDDETGEARPAYFDHENGEWVDVWSGHRLSASEMNSVRHYQMIVSYDERIRNADTQPPGLPKGGKTIFGGIARWDELP